jgi:hypothetical protein
MRYEICFSLKKKLKLPNKFNCFGLVLMAVLLGSIHHVFGQQPTERIVLSSEKIEEIYHLAFPRVTSTFDAVKDEFSLDVRISPSFRAPVQVSIVKRQDGTIFLTRYTLSNPSVSLSDQVFAMLERGEPSDAVHLSRGLNVVSRQTADARELNSILHSFFSRTRFPISREITLDGVGYQIWYIDSVSEVHFSHVGSERFERGEFPIITWARSIDEKSLKIIASNTKQTKK